MARRGDKASRLCACVASYNLQTDVEQAKAARAVWERLKLENGSSDMESSQRFSALGAHERVDKTDSCVHIKVRNRLVKVRAGPMDT